jgi:hypothetical protein
MLSQKIAMESSESRALAVARTFVLDERSGNLGFFAERGRTDHIVNNRRARFPSAIADLGANSLIVTPVS